MPGYKDTWIGAVAAGHQFHLTRTIAPACPCGSTVFDMDEPDSAPDHHHRVRCMECGKWTDVRDLVNLYESGWEYHDMGKGVFGMSSAECAMDRQEQYEAHRRSEEDWN